ncbi:hypothetical protein CPC16_009145 [Podila verticillata]|nr:hypothetical protein CPC16_009145 [Podila verticillata]KAI9238920.1 MAG: hypothetical protein BYD32DRAFT_412539 [Podila humilis]
MKYIASLTLLALMILVPILTPACAMDTALDRCSREATDFEEFRTCLDGIRAEEVVAAKEEACLTLCAAINNCDSLNDDCLGALTDCERGCV